MFQGDYIDVKLAKTRSFGDIGESDTVRVLEPSSAFLQKSYKSEEESYNAIMEYIAKNTLVVKDGIAHKISNQQNILHCISLRDGQKLIRAFTELSHDGVASELPKEQGLAYN